MDLRIYSWGSNSHGQLGLGSEEEQTLFPVPVNTGIKPKYVTGGGKHTILISVEDEIFCCGDNDKGQLGKDCTIKSLNTFQPLNHKLKVTNVSCGWDFNLALTENFEVFAWGSNAFGQLGISVKKVRYSSIPLKVFEKKVKYVSAGLRHSALIDDKGFIFTCGYGRKGQLGFNINEGASSVDKFTLVSGIENCEEISCGECHCIARTGNGEFFSWGNNKYGQLGCNPNITPFSITPIKISVSIKKTFSLCSGWAHNFILTGKGELISWGRNDFGQLGEERAQTWKPEFIRGLDKIKQISSGSHHSVALTENNEVFTWGWNEHGNCGNGSIENVKNAWKLKFSGVKLIGSGAAHSFFYDLVSRMFGIMNESRILELRAYNFKPHEFNEVITEIPVIPPNLEYSEFFESFLLANKPCIINNASENWPCASHWVRKKSLNTDHLKSTLRNVEVPVSDCNEREFNSQKKCSMKLFDYLNYWEKYKNSTSETDCLYLKDWHFVKNFPDENIYTVPPYFASDWLNEYYDNNPHLNDDYKFIYIGPKGSWTPLHADVFTSYSWSVNICGRKKWVLLPPGAENQLKDAFGNFNYNVDWSQVCGEGEKNKLQSFEVIQEEGQGIFVPSGWHHQVWNLEPTVSVNHNWINGCNIHYMWEALKKNLDDVMEEISDCKDMENWTSQCQLVLSASFGIDYKFFHSFLFSIAKSRIEALRGNKNITVYGNWAFGENQMKFDLIQALKILNLLENDVNFLETEKDEELNHSVEFLNSLSSCEWAIGKE